jgi:GAF domain-containing protein
LYSYSFDQNQGCADDTTKIPLESGIAGFVAKTGEEVMVADPYQDSRFLKEVDEKTGYVTKNILCTPIRDLNGDIVGVAEMVNKRKVTSSNLCIPF